MSKLLYLKLLFAVTLLLLLPIVPSLAHAITFDELVEEGKRLLGGEETAKSLSGDPKINITSDIKLTEDGDVNGNGEMDAGDTVRFFFVIENGTDQLHPFSNLKTNIKRDSIHFIHNVKGVTGIDNSTLELPNIYVLPNSKLEISFDAKLNFSGEAEETAVGESAAKTIDTASDKEISSQPLLEDNKKKKLSEGAKKIKKFRAGALKDKSQLILKNNKEENPVKAEEKIKPEIASPSAREAGKEASPSPDSTKNKIATPSARE